MIEQQNQLAIHFFTGSSFPSIWLDNIQVSSESEAWLKSQASKAQDEPSVNTMVLFQKVEEKITASLYRPISLCICIWRHIDVGVVFH